MQDLLARITASRKVIMCIQVEETFMQHVVRHWQGSLTEADSTAAMQADAEFSLGGSNGSTASGAVAVRSHTTQFSDDGECCCLMYAQRQSCGPMSTISVCLLLSEASQCHRCANATILELIASLQLCKHCNLSVSYTRNSNVRTALQVRSVRD